MKNDELKFVLKLLGYRGYRCKLSEFKGSTFKRKNSICLELGDRRFLEYSKEIGKIKLLAAGKALLKMESNKIPLEKNELKVLESLTKVTGVITPTKLNLKGIKAAERDDILKELGVKGFIEITEQIKRQKAEVWLTNEGLKYLRDEFIPSKGTHPIISLELLSNYLKFLRKPQSETVILTVESATKLDKKTSDEHILETIIKLDQELGTENYLPIFYLRNKLQPALTREELDQALYRLESEDKLELSALAEGAKFSNEEIEAGIPKNTGGYLFFLKVIN